MRRFIELERTVPGVFRVRRVFKGDAPLNDLIVGAPAEKTDADLLQSVLVHGHWMPTATYVNGDTEKRGAVQVSRDEVLWTGHAFNLSGYAKANREILSRIRHSIKVRLSSHGISDVSWHNDEAMDHMLKSLKRNTVSSHAPYVRFYTPTIEVDPRYRICWTMMETQALHPDFRDKLNAYYDEIWVPTHWNKQMFEDCGVRRPIRVMPLGVDPCIYRPLPGASLPKCKLITGTRAGANEVPPGFVFFSLYQPTFRKGTDVLAQAFEQAFKHDQEAALVLGVTAYSVLGKNLIAEIRRWVRKARVYAMTGDFRERDLAVCYSASHAFVSASRGEGWNLPMCEAAACGKPVIVPYHTAHLDLVTNEECFVFDPGPPKPYPGSAPVCGWYDKMPFATYTPRSIECLAELMVEVKGNYSAALERAERFTKKVRTSYTWDRTSVAVLDRLSNL